MYLGSNCSLWWDERTFAPDGAYATKIASDANGEDAYSEVISSVQTPYEAWRHLGQADPARRPLALRTRGWRAPTFTHSPARELRLNDSQRPIGSSVFESAMRYLMGANGEHTFVACLDLPSEA